MSDWEDIFGAGYSAESLISSINRVNRAEQRDEDRNTERQRVSKMTSSGSFRELRFSNLDEAEAWVHENPGFRWDRKRDGDGFIMKVYNRS